MTTELSAGPQEVNLPLGSPLGLKSKIYSLSVHFPEKVWKIQYTSKGYEVTWEQWITSHLFFRGFTNTHDSSTSLFHPARPKWPQGSAFPRARRWVLGTWWLVAKPKAREGEKEREAVTRPFPRSTVLSGPSGLHWVSLTAWCRLCEIERTSRGVAENSAWELSLFHPLGENEKTHFHHQLKG